MRDNDAQVNMLLYSQVYAGLGGPVRVSHLSRFTVGGQFYAPQLSTFINFVLNPGHIPNGLSLSHNTRFTVGR